MATLRSMSQRPCKVLVPRPSRLGLDPVSLDDSDIHVLAWLQASSAWCFGGAWRGSTSILVPCPKRLLEQDGIVTEPTRTVELARTPLTRQSRD